MSGEEGHASFGFVELTIGLMGAASGEGNLVPLGGKLGEEGLGLQVGGYGGELVKLSGSGRESFTGKILSRQAKDGVFDGHRWNNLSTCHCSIATPKKKISDARKNNDVPCPS